MRALRYMGAMRDMRYLATSGYLAAKWIGASHACRARQQRVTCVLGLHGCPVCHAWRVRNASHDGRRCKPNAITGGQSCTVSYATLGVRCTRVMRDMRAVCAMQHDCKCKETQAKTCLLGSSILLWLVSRWVRDLRVLRGYHCGTCVQRVQRVTCVQCVSCSTERKARNAFRWAAPWCRLWHSSGACNACSAWQVLSAWHAHVRWSHALPAANAATFGGVDFRRPKQNELAGQQPFAIACESASARLPCIAGTACSHDISAVRDLGAMLA